jgi:hypothetical protein
VLPPKSLAGMVFFLAKNFSSLFKQCLLQAGGLDDCLDGLSRGRDEFPLFCLPVLVFSSMSVPVGVLFERGNYRVFQIFFCDIVLRVQVLFRFLCPFLR